MVANIVIRFAADDTVVFSDRKEDKSDVDQLRRVMGEGPFTVLQVEEMDTTCNCGLDHESKQEHDKDCGVYRATRAKHPQYLYITGRDNIPRVLLGRWFVHTP